MSKFKVLESVETNLTWLGIRFDRMAELTNEFFTSFPPYHLVIVSIASITSAGMFIYSNWPNLVVIFQSSTIVSLTLVQVNGMFLNLGLRMKKVKTLHFRLQDIVNKQGQFIFVDSCIFDSSK